ncbi:hypothetical protein O181_017921 [Austropuccinia psidii MF-1]|uniref:Uncharacterized protein n=1 Tax=Austropuccinia psidii MF-1 TaxID=1389203 RepID=A0A9Q3C8K3_9BASI|nr:hypothetical protein [Austropuccinia psidii MF-1]
MSKKKLFDIVEEAPENSNPFSYAAATLLSQLSPRPPAYVLSALTVALSIYVALSICCGAIILLPFFQGPESRARHNWLFKRLYLGEFTTPYFVINNGLFVAGSYLIASIMFEIFIVLNYSAIKSHSRVNMHGFIWIEMRWFPGYCAFFVQALTTLYTRASNPNTGGFGKYCIPPLIFNSILLGFPVIIGALSLFLTARKLEAAQKQAWEFEAIVAMLTKAAREWNDGRQKMTSSQQKLLEAAYSKYLRKTELKLHSIRHIGLFWSVMGIPAIVLYILGVVTLLKSINTRVRDMNQISSVENSQIAELDKFGTESFSSSKILKNNSWSNLGRSFKFLWSHYLAMALTLSYDVALGLGCYLQKEDQFKDPARQAIFFVLNLSGGFFMLIAMLALLARMIIEEKTLKKESEEKNASDHEKGFELSKATPL